jgi:thioredoxin-related protein
MLHRKQTDRAGEGKAGMVLARSPQGQLGIAVDLHHPPDTIRFENRVVRKPFPEVFSMMPAMRSFLDRPALAFAWHGVSTARSTLLKSIAVTAFGLLALLLAPASGEAVADDLQWHESLDAALASAKASGKPILTVFTGSDWCPHCKTLDRNILKSGTFRDWAGENVVLLEIDMPRKGISSEVRNARSQVCRSYGVRSYPTVMLIGSDGKAIYRKSGYGGQSPQQWIATMAKQLP